MNFILEFFEGFIAMAVLVWGVMVKHTEMKGQTIEDLYDDKWKCFEKIFYPRLKSVHKQENK